MGAPSVVLRINSTSQGAINRKPSHTKPLSNAGARLSNRLTNKAWAVYKMERGARRQDVNRVNRPTGDIGRFTQI